MAVSKVSQREIVEVPFQLPDGSIKAHMGLVKREYFDSIINKVILSMFDIEIM